MTIKAIIWDMGGVLVRTEDWSHREKLANSLNMTIEELSFVVFGDDDGLRAQKGEVGYDEHWTNVAAKLRIPKESLTTFRNEFFSGDQVDMDLIDSINQWRLKYKTALLSNAFMDLRKVLTEEYKITHAFDRIFVSAEMRLIKPDHQIYHQVLKEMGCKPEESIFIDDNLDNVAAADELGMNSVHFVTPDQVLAEIQAIMEKEDLCPKLQQNLS
ncbi:MAG: HAD family phosphatase [Anaerolineales bacterium]|nr:HAD family phosphatase [Anaerolineales bacterium]